MKDWRDALIWTLAMILWAVTINTAYKSGVEDGYWEHEAEENVYNCRVFNG